MINIASKDYIHGANHSLSAIFIQMRHMFLAGPAPFYTRPPCLTLHPIHFFKMFFSLFLFSQDSKTSALNWDIFLLEVLMGIILPSQVHSKATCSYLQKKWPRDSLEMAVNYAPRPCAVWVRDSSPEGHCKIFFFKIWQKYFY